jgi:hypothetical protein
LLNHAVLVSVFDTVHLASIPIEKYALVGYYSLLNNAEERNSQLVCCGSLKPLKYRGADKFLVRPGKEKAHRALATQKKLAYLGFQCLDHPPYSPDLAPSEYHLFPGLKKTIEREVGRAKDLPAPL